MKITVDRLTYSPNSTISTVLIDEVFQCFGLEDVPQEIKIRGKTCIPSGIYHIGVRSVGGTHKKYRRKYPHWHQGMLQILNVPGFDYILIHIGNYHTNTEGCLLVGESVNKSGKTRDYSVGNSQTAYIDFYKKVIGAAIRGRLIIEICNNDTEDFGDC